MKIRKSAKICNMCLRHTFWIFLNTIHKSSDSKDISSVHFFQNLKPAQAQCEHCSLIFSSSLVYSRPEPTLFSISLIFRDVFTSLEDNILIHRN